MVAAALALAGHAMAQVVPWHSLFPRPRPATIGMRPVVAMPSGTLQRAPGTDLAVLEAMGVTTTHASAVARSLLPRPRPAAAAARHAALRDAPRPSVPVRAAAAPSEDGPVRRGICGVLGLEGQELARIRGAREGCGVDRPVRVLSVHGVPLSQGARMDCDMARALAEWVDDAMLPAVGRRGGGVAQITVIGEYSCRTRNNRRGARISEHGRGRAIDIAGYRLADGETVRIIEDYRRGRHRRDLREMYRAACGIFTTTLSPDADRYHQDHFHFDLARHRGGGTYCR